MQFSLIAAQRTREETEASVASLGGHTTIPPLSFDNILASVEKLIAMATHFYDEYTRKEVWSAHVKSTKPPGGVMTTSTPPTCFNCGGQHHVDSCPQPIDQAKVERQKQKYRNNQRKRHSTKGNGTNKKNSNNSTKNDGRSTQNANTSGPSTARAPDSRFRPPVNDKETHRFIWTKARGNQPYQWNPTKNRWDLQENPSSGGAPTSGGAHTTTTTTPATSNADTAALRADFAQLHSTLMKLMDKI
ncbi:hypothetical protein IV203_027663 [Nitzschia inconspicua]|uniref:Uncharacterized protein n=1 Tax=Nitzschia inconspicua TaxID=303405 RepID=A0A9K3LX38_9STRA|nr:hypothetical protein IV203_027663 [Nitzschia inconspicua]